MMTEAARSRMRRLCKLVRVQWIIILALFVALTISIFVRPAASVKAEPLPTATARVVSEPAIEPKPEPIEEPDPDPEPELIELGVFKTTAYCTCVKCCGIWSDEHPSRVGTDYVQKTRSGTIPTEGRTVSVDPDVIPLGSVIVIDGHEYIAEDTGSAVKGNIIDVYLSSHDAAREYGVQYKTIYIKGE